jgi:hypothetical protein
MDSKHWGRLWQDARVAFDAYVHETHQTFHLLTEVKFPVPMEKRLEIVE